LLWVFAFGSFFFPQAFWVKLSISCFLLLLLALTRRSKMKFKVSVLGLAIGLVSAVLLYLFFWAGYHVMSSVPGFVGTISSVYGYAGQTPLSIIAVLLFFPIGPGEEFYWRGFIQRYLSTTKWASSAKMSIVIASLIYASIHIVTMNPSLLFVAFVGGLVWGTIYAKTNGNLFPVLVSHMVFDEMIFVFFMIGG
jgi:membrane protease YdiL (CAAX protease family)